MSSSESSFANESKSISSSLSESGTGRLEAELSGECGRFDGDRLGTDADEGGCRCGGFGGGRAGVVGAALLDDSSGGGVTFCLPFLHIYTLISEDPTFSNQMKQRGALSSFIYP